MITTKKRGVSEVKNKELFNRANADGDLKLQEKLRSDYTEWCEKNCRTPLTSQSVIDWWNEDVIWVV